jgi:hypothetical protein
MPDREKHPRHIRIRRQGEEDAPGAEGLDFRRHTSLRPVGRSTHLLVVLALIVVVGGFIASLVLRQSEPAPSLASPAAEAFGPLLPSGEAVLQGLTFVWAPHPQAGGYELVLEDRKGRAIWTARLGPEARVALPPDLADTLQPGQPYVWRVTALLPGGETEEGPPLAFVVR